MGGLYNTLGAGLNTIMSQQRGIAVTGHNIANANTDGFHRQEVSVKSLSNTTYGIQVDTVRRASDQFLQRQVFDHEAEYGDAKARSEGLARIESVLADTGDQSITATLDDYFASWQELVVFADKKSQRDEVLASTKLLVNAVQRNANALDTAKDDANDDIAASIDEVNDLINNICSYNQQITEAESYGYEANELRDHRDQAGKMLSRLTGAESRLDKDGFLNVTIGGGVHLVLREGKMNLQAVHMDTDGDGTGDSQLWEIHTDQESISLDVDTLIKGEIGGLVRLRDEDLTDRIKELDEFAYDLVNATNAVHSANFSSSGVTGQNFFTALSSAEGAAQDLEIHEDIVADAMKIAAANDTNAHPGDGQGAQEMADMMDSLVATSGTKTLHEAANDFQTNFLFAMRDAGKAEEAAESRLRAIEEVMESHFGVSIEEEMMMLSRYQRAFQSSSKVLSVVDEMIQTVINLK